MTASRSPVWAHVAHNPTSSGHGGCAGSRAIVYFKPDTHQGNEVAKDEQKRAPDQHHSLRKHLKPSALPRQPASVGVQSCVHFLLGCRRHQKRSPRRRLISPMKRSTNWGLWTTSSSRIRTILRICYLLMCARTRKSLGRYRNRLSEERRADRELPQAQGTKDGTTEDW